MMTKSTTDKDLTRMACQPNNGSCGYGCNMKDMKKIMEEAVEHKNILIPT